MKNLMFALVAVLALASCSGNGEATVNATADSTACCAPANLDSLIQDTTVVPETTAVATETAVK
jgi:hypothetical protein